MAEACPSLGVPRQLRRAMLTASALALLLALIALTASAARAGTWRLLSCSGLDGASAPIEGWASGSTGTVGPYSGALDTCEQGGTLTARTSGEAPQSAYAGPEWIFTAPAGSTIAGGTITATLSAPHGQAWLATPQASYDSADVLANCQYNLPCGPAGTLTGTFAITHTGGTHIYATAVCVGEREGENSCPVDGGSDATVAISAANIELASDATPTARDFAGALLQSAAARGAEDLTFTASDPEGPGVRLVTVQLDGETAFAGTPEDNGGLCIPTSEQEGIASFITSQPCKQSEAIDLPIDTTSVPDGQHTLKVTITDAANNSSTVFDQTITTDNAPAALTPPAIAGDAQAGSTLSASAGEWSAPSGAGAVSQSYQWEACEPEGNRCEAITGATATSYTPEASNTGDTVRVQVTATDNDGQTTDTSPPTTPIAAASALSGLPGPGAATPLGAGQAIANGTNASGHAQLTLATPVTLKRPYARSAVTITGRLTNAQGEPIGGANLDVVEEVMTGAPEPVTPVSTAANGEFHVRIPRGASRTLTIGYRAFSTEAGESSEARVSETVSAGVQLHVSPQRTSPGGTITISGAVSGPVPHGGVLVVLLVHYRGAWVAFRTARTDSDGHFAVRYQFQGAAGRFPFRAQAPGGQTGFPYASGTSAAIAVRTG